MLGTAAIACVVAGGIVAAKRLRTKLDQDALDHMREFAETFPGECYICFMHRGAWHNGATRNPYPEPHRCIEHRPRPAPVPTPGGTHENIS